MNYKRVPIVCPYCEREGHISISEQRMTHALIREIYDCEFCGGEFVYHAYPLVNVTTYKIGDGSMT